VAVEGAPHANEEQGAMAKHHFSDDDLPQD
jgi:hypothetical protein